MKAVATPNRMNGASLTPEVRPSAPLFSADAVKMQHQMRINPLPTLNPSMLGVWLDQFNYGYLRQFVLVAEAMCERDDTLITVKPQLENEVASKEWGVFTIPGADPKEAARHKACLDYFYNNLKATDAYDRNVRGGRDKLIEQLMSADSFRYTAHHFVWRPQPGKTVPVKIQDKNGQDVELAPVPVIAAELEHVPLWFFENTTGKLRLLKDGGFGIDGTPLEAFGDWIVSTGRGLMIAASICYTFKRLSFQDWTIFNERYAQNKVIGVTPGKQDSVEGRAMAAVVEAYNSDQGFVFYEYTGDPEKPPVSLVGPQGTAAVEIWDKFIERQDRKMSSMYRGNDLSMMSRAGRGEKPTGASLQEEEGDDMVRGACRRISGACQEMIDRRVIELCFGFGVVPLAYFGLPDSKNEDITALIAAAGFLADRNFEVSASDVAERAGIQKARDEEDVLGAAPAPMGNAEGETGNEGNPSATPNSALRNSKSQADLERFLGPLVPQFKQAFADDLIPVRLALEHVLRAAPGDFTANTRALQAQLPWLLKQVATHPRSAGALATIMETALARGISEAAANRS